MTLLNERMRILENTPESTMPRWIHQRISEWRREVAQLEAGQQDWRKGVELIASALGEHNPPNLSCVRIAEIALELRAENERLQKDLLACKEAAKWADDMRKTYKRQLNEVLGGEK